MRTATIVRSVSNKITRFGQKIPPKIAPHVFPVLVSMATSTQELDRLRYGTLPPRDDSTGASTVATTGTFAGEGTPRFLTYLEEHGTAFGVAKGMHGYCPAADIGFMYTYDTLSKDVPKTATPDGSKYKEKTGRIVPAKGTDEIVFATNIALFNTQTKRRQTKPTLELALGNLLRYHTLNEILLKEGQAPTKLFVYDYMPCETHTLYSPNEIQLQQPPDGAHLFGGYVVNIDALRGDHHVQQEMFKYIEERKNDIGLELPLILYSPRTPSPEPIRIITDPNEVQSLIDAARKDQTIEIQTIFADSPAIGGYTHLGTPTTEQKATIKTAMELLRFGPDGALGRR